MRMRTATVTLRAWACAVDTCERTLRHLVSGLSPHTCAKVRTGAREAKLAALQLWEVCCGSVVYFDIKPDNFRLAQIKVMSP